MEIGAKFLNIINILYIKLETPTSYASQVNFYVQKHRKTGDLYRIRVGEAAGSSEEPVLHLIYNSLEFETY